MKVVVPVRVEVDEDLDGVAESAAEAAVYEAIEGMNHNTYEEYHLVDKPEIITSDIRLPDRCQCNREYEELDNGIKRLTSMDRSPCSVHETVEEQKKSGEE